MFDDILNAVIHLPIVVYSSHANINISITVGRMRTNSEIKVTISFIKKYA